MYRKPGCDYRLKAWKACLLIISIIFATPAEVNAQVQEGSEWDPIPWILLGDSTLVPDRNSKLVVTGKIINADTGEPISGASVSADFFKHYDYSDDNGNYFLKLPRGSIN